MIAIDLECGETWQFDNSADVRVLCRGYWELWEVNERIAERLRPGEYILDVKRGPLLITELRKF